tara:strand:+ start:1973 stop:2377 length:405 start_codon:yes stop_codon:yes gene_type:complete
MKAQITQFWNEGKSGTEIATLLHITRNAVIGHVTRMRERGVILRVAEKKTKRKGKRIVQERPTSAGWRKFVVEEPTPAPTDLTRRVSIMELQMSECRFVVGKDEDAGALFCAEPVTQVSYCSDHYRMCYNPARV